MTYATAVHSAIDGQVDIFNYQLKRIGLLALAAAGVILIEKFIPHFFDYQYFKWGGWVSVGNFWPLFAWGAGLYLFLRSTHSSYLPIRITDNRELFKWHLITSTLAGIWEELGYRWAFICYAMLGIVVANWLFSSGVGLAVSVVAAGGAAVLWHEKEKGTAYVAIGVAVVAALFALYANPLYWFYQIMVYVIHFTTLTLMDPVLYGNNHNAGFIFGAVAANAWFRDGHKYQGPLGIVNSWYAGMVLLYATVTYGLLTAIVVHILYDVILSLLRFVLQPTR